MTEQSKHQPSPSSPSAAEANLSADIKFFLHDVSPKLKHLLVSSGSSMDVATAAIKRFSSVTDVFVYSLIAEPVIQQMKLIRIDKVTSETVVPFITNLPSFEYCYLGGRVREWEKDRIWSENGIRCDEVSFGPRGFSNSTAKVEMARLITNVCKAFKDGNLSTNVNFKGLLPDQDIALRRRCGWKNIQFAPPLHPDVVEESLSTTSDMNIDCCQICGMICTFFPPLHVMQFATALVPCVSSADRFQIGRKRDPENYLSNLTTMLLDELPQQDVSNIMCPPDFEKLKIIISYEECQLADMTTLVSMGANVKDARMRQVIVGEGVTIKGDEGWLVQNKRILALDTFEELKRIGFDITESDFFLVDTSDRRTSVYLHNWKNMKDGLKLSPNPESAQRAIERFAADMSLDVVEVRKRVKGYVDGTHPSRLTILSMYDFLKDWLDTDNELLDGHAEAIQALWLEAI